MKAQEPTWKIPKMCVVGQDPEILKSIVCRMYSASVERPDFLYKEDTA